jgi:hypothetical protein
VSDPAFPTPVFVFMGTPDEGRTFLDAHWPGAIGIADPDKILYEAFSVPRGGLREMFGLRSWVAGVRATLKGKLIGRRHGDPWTLPVLALLHGEEVTWRHVGAHAGDHPRIDDIPRIIIR